MQFTRMLLGWLAAGLVFLAADRLRHRLTGGRAGTPRWAPFAEALPFTLLLALWMASLGGGAWWLVVALLALAIEAPARVPELARGEAVRSVLGKSVPTLGKLLVAGLALRVVL